MDNPAQSKERTARRWMPFAYGFRPFFLVALVYAPLVILIWLWLRTVNGLPLRELPPQLWHGHEMIFGFVSAAIAGFLLTAIPSWTSARGFAGKPLVGLTILWFAGRLAFACANWLPLPIVATVELLFFPTLLVLLAPPLLRSYNRNTPLLIVLLALWSADAIFFHALLHSDIPLATRMLRMSINIVLLLITVIGGRIIPASTNNALRKHGIDVRVHSWRWLEITVIAMMSFVVVIDVAAPLERAAASIASIAALAHALRLAGWQSQRIFKEPVVWVLHLGYGWLPAGLALKAIYLHSAAPWAAHWLHALTIGVIAMMVVAVITRTSLGYTGRQLQVSRWIALAYLLLWAAALVRVFSGILFTSYEWSVRISGTLWIIAFVVILTVYAPILLRSRADGRAG